MPTKRQVITIATGKKLYLDLAVNLARSFRLWHTDGSVGFQLITDIPDLVPPDVRSHIQIVTVRPGEIGLGFSPKLHLDEMVSDGQTLFIDSDCLIYKNLGVVFDIFDGRKVSVIGNYVTEGEWFGDVKRICSHFGIKQMPKFNGGVYYLEKSDMANAVYETARKIEMEYDQIGFRRLRGRPNDEVILSASMELHGQVPVPEDGTIMAEFINFRSGIKSNVLRGIAELYNKPANKYYQPGWHLTIAKPAIVHFLGHHHQVLPYLKEAKLLKYQSKGKVPVSIARLITLLLVTGPHRTKSVLKSFLRPVYHLFFGARKIKKSERIID